MSEPDVEPEYKEPTRSCSPFMLLLIPLACLWTFVAVSVAFVEKFDAFLNSTDFPLPFMSAVVLSAARWVRGGNPDQWVPGTFWVVMVSFVALVVIFWPRSSRAGDTETKPRSLPMSKYQVMQLALLAALLTSIGVVAAVGIPLINLLTALLG